MSAQATDSYSPPTPTDVWARAVEVADMAGFKQLKNLPELLYTLAQTMEEGEVCDVYAGLGYIAYALRSREKRL